MGRSCPTCGSKLAEPAMDPVELKLVRALLGVRAGLGGRLPNRDFAGLLGRTPRQLYNYLHGRTPIPPNIARRARRLRDKAPR